MYQVCVFPNEGHFNPLTNNYGKVVINFKTKKHVKFKKIGKYDISTYVDSFYHSNSYWL